MVPRSGHLHEPDLVLSKQRQYALFKFLNGVTPFPTSHRRNHDQVFQGKVPALRFMNPTEQNSDRFDPKAIGHNRDEGHHGQSSCGGSIVKWTVTAREDVDASSEPALKTGDGGKT